MSQPGSGVPAPLVTIFITTYNELAFIGHAVESVVRQRAPFPFSVVVLDDCSTDGTQAELQRLRERHSDHITLRLAERNQCSNAPLAAEIRACATPYLAMLDGDDFWLSPDKLRLQVEWLEANPDLAMCFHDVAICDAGGVVSAERYTHPDQPRRMSLDDMWHGNVIATCSALYRTATIRDLPAWYDSLEYGDWPVHLLAARHGDVGYAPDVLAAYRRHAGGLWSRLSVVEQIEGTIRFYEAMMGPFGGRCGQRIGAAMASHYGMLATEQDKLGLRERAAASRQHAAALGGR